MDQTVTNLSVNGTAQDELLEKESVNPWATGNSSKFKTRSQRSKNKKKDTKNTKRPDDSDDGSDTSNDARQNVPTILISSANSSKKLLRKSQDKEK